MQGTLLWLRTMNRVHTLFVDCVATTLLRGVWDEVEQLGFAHEGEYGSLRWLQVPTSSEPVDLLSRDHLRVLADFNPTRDDLIPFLDILREGNVGRPILMRRPLVTYLVLPFTLRAVPAAVVFEQRDHVHAAIVIEARHTDGYSLAFKLTGEVAAAMALPTLPTLAWAGDCLCCGSKQLDFLSDFRRIPTSRRGLLGTVSLLDWRVTFFTHYYGPVVYWHRPKLCQECAALHFSNFVVPSDDPLRMELANTASVCLHTNFGSLTFGLDFLRHLECQFTYGSLSFQAALGAYYKFWGRPTTDFDTARHRLPHVYLLYILLDFLQLDGVEEVIARVLTLMSQGAGF
ncbi:unnamed protein product [Symbiodinium sp. KB8]|nr:unnamed protein product [Symbiodinium sp. KB8]